MTDRIDAFDSWTVMHKINVKIISLIQANVNSLVILSRLIK